MQLPLELYTEFILIITIYTSSKCGNFHFLVEVMLLIFAICVFWKLGCVWLADRELERNSYFHGMAILLFG